MHPAEIVLVDSLRERYFGDALELQTHELYDSVWAVDALDTSKGPEGGGVRIDN